MVIVVSISIWSIPRVAWLKETLFVNLAAAYQNVAQNSLEKVALVVTIRRCRR
jgi:hypothetical protein